MNTHATISTALALTRSLPKSARVNAVRRKGVVTGIELAESYAGERGTEVYIVATINLDGDGRPVMSDARGRLVDGDGDDLPTPHGACETAQAMREWFNELS